MRFLVISLFSFLTLAVNAEDLNWHHHKYIAVVDAGSTGSRLHIYTYDLDRTKTPINIKELWSKKVKPGLATLETKQDIINNYLDSLFSDTPRKNLPVYFYATAGMRLLPQPKQQQFFNQVKNWFAQTTWDLRSSKTITGTDEGLYGWLAVNYKLDTLNSHKPKIGVMDIGGASIQLTFPVTETADISSADLKQLNLYGHSMQLFTHSFLGLGQNEMAHQYLDVSSCFPNGYIMPTNLPAEGNAYSCENEVSLLLNKVHHVKSIVEPVVKANPMNDWFVLGGAPELVKSQPFQFVNNQFTNQNLLEQANSLICQQQWSILTNQYPNEEYLYSYCLYPSFYYALMVEGYGLQPQQLINYPKPDQVSDWTLGVVLYPTA